MTKGGGGLSLGDGGKLSEAGAKVSLGAEGSFIYIMVRSIFHHMFSFLFLYIKIYSLVILEYYSIKKIIRIEETDRFKRSEALDCNGKKINLMTLETKLSLFHLSFIKECSHLSTTMIIIASLQNFMSFCVFLYSKTLYDNNNKNQLLCVKSSIMLIDTNVPI